MSRVTIIAYELGFSHNNCSLTADERTKNGKSVSIRAVITVEFIILVTHNFFPILGRFVSNRMNVLF